jgi:hypothetical protein
MDLAQDLAATALGEEARSLFKAMGGSLESQQPIKLEGRYPGLEYRGSITKPKPGKMHGKLHVVGQRVFNVAVAGTEDMVKSEKATQFLESFKPE